MFFAHDEYSVEHDIEFNPYFNEIEYILSEYDSQTDPLGERDNISRDVDWYSISERTETLLTECFDLRVALWKMRANLHINGISALYQGLYHIDKSYTDDTVTVFPQSEPEQPSDSIHAAALGWLATTSCIHEIKNSLIFPDTRLTIDELLNLRPEEQEGKRLHYSEVVKVIGHANAFFATKQLPSLQEQLSLGLETLERIENYANLHAEGYRLDCRHIRDYLQASVRSLTSLEQHVLPIDNEGAQTDSPEEENSVPGACTNRQFRSRQDVILVLDQVLNYFQQHEPGHPAPILIRRSQKMIGMDFTTLIEELLPEALPSLQQLAGR